MEAAIVPAGSCIITLPVSKIPLIARKAGWRFRNAANLDRIPYVKTARGCARYDRELARERYLSIARHPHSSFPRWNDQIVPSADVVFSLLFLSLFFSSLIFITSDLASKDSRELFRIFRGFLSLSLSLSLDLSNFVYFFILAYGDSRGFFRIFLIFVELDLFDRQFSFSRWLSFIRIVDNFSSFFVRFIELRMKSQFIFSLFCRWFLYSSLLGFSKSFSNLLTIFLFEIFGSLRSFSCRFYPIFLVVFEKTSLSLLFTDFSLLLFRLLLKFLAMDLY